MLVENSSFVESLREKRSIAWERFGAYCSFSPANHGNLKLRGSRFTSGSRGVMTALFPLTIRQPSFHEGTHRSA
jgi:hypothetical protein